MLLKELEKSGDLKVFEDELDVNLEIPHIAYAEIKKSDPKVLLFNNPVDREMGIKYDIPVLMNLFASYKLTERYLSRPVEEIAGEIEKLLKIKPPSGLKDKIGMASDLFSLKAVFPKREIKKEKNSKNYQKIYRGDEVDLHKLPILKTWSEDGGKFITMGQLYSESLEGGTSNVGMYRLQVFENNKLGMHWQIHKDTTGFFHDYKKAGKKMPISIVVGGDPAYTWSATAPLPHGVNELLLYGFAKKESAKLIECDNGLWVPKDGDILIEGYVDPNEMRIEGPFGDHTGYYTLEEEYPVMTVESIKIRKNPLYYATVVGKPPLEDKYMGWATERIFLPLLKTTAPDLIDYSMPENGVFHNLIIGKMEVKYKGHPKQFMHAFWGVGQMSFVKNAIFVDENAPDLEDYDKLVPHILNRFGKRDILISEGVLDALDHSSPEALVGGKLGIDATGEPLNLPKLNILSDSDLLQKVKEVDSNFVDLKQFYTDTENPITVITVNKVKGQGENLRTLSELSEHIRIAVIVDDKINSLDNPYMLLWRVVNNIDSLRDLYNHNSYWGVDATNKNSDMDDFPRQWPGDVVCDPEVLQDLRNRGLIDLSDDEVDKFQLV